MSKLELAIMGHNDVPKSAPVQSHLSLENFKQSKDLTDGSKTENVSEISKLEDALEAGHRNSDKCTLILTEGDSAKRFPMDGLSVIGREYYGVFPLTGKLLNVREASPQLIKKNKKINCIMQILGWSKIRIMTVSNL